jgi:transposase-like protein
MFCPRCDSATVEKMVDAPKDKSWEVYICSTCCFSWRSTEDESVTNPALYDKRFKIDPSGIDKLLPIPPIPPLKKV